MNLCQQRDNGRFTATHGMKHSKTYGVWEAMFTRVKSRPAYVNRGISVCDEWLQFENFYADMGDAPIGMSLDRIDNNGNYSKDNCRWATRVQQNNNKSTNIVIEWNGKRQTRAQWEKEFGMKPTTLRSRFRSGWSLERAMQPLAEGNTPLPAENA